MAVKIIGLIIGVLVLGAGIYYLAKEKHDPEYLYRAGEKGPSASRQTCACYIAGKFRRL